MKKSQFLNRSNFQASTDIPVKPFKSFRFVGILVNWIYIHVKSEIHKGHTIAGTGLTCMSVLIYSVGCMSPHFWSVKLILFQHRNTNLCHNFIFTIHSRINRINILKASLINKFVGWNITVFPHTLSSRGSQWYRRGRGCGLPSFFGGVGAQCKTRGDYSPPDR